MPTDWQSYLDAAAALKKNNIYGYGTGVRCRGLHRPARDRLLDDQQRWWTLRRAEAAELRHAGEHRGGELRPRDGAKGYVDPASATYTSANVQSQWKAKKFAMGYDTGGLADNIGGDVAKDLSVISPLTSPSGKKGALYFPNNIMIYKNNPSIKGTRGVPHLLLPEHGAAVDPEHRHRPPAPQVDRQDRRVPGRQEQGADHRGVAADLQDMGRSGWRRPTSSTSRRSTLRLR